MATASRTTFVRCPFSGRQIPLYASKLPGFGSARAAKNFARGYVWSRRVVANRRTKVEPFVVVSPSTAKRNGWRVVS
jgi:hypothetical protein